MKNAYSIDEATRERIVESARTIAHLWGNTHTVTFHGPKPDIAYDQHWELGEARCLRHDGRVFGLSAEEVYSEQGVDGDFRNAFEAAEVAVAPVGAAAAAFEASEPWLAVVDVDSAPKVVWRTTTATPLDYAQFREWSTE